MLRKKTVSAENHDRWLVSYADFITLLFAFFVVMFASTQSNKLKAKEVSEATIIEAIQYAHSEIRRIVAAQKELFELLGLKKRECTAPLCGAGRDLRGAAEQRPARTAGAGGVAHQRADRAASDE